MSLKRKNRHILLLILITFILTQLITPAFAGVTAEQRDLVSKMMIDQISQKNGKPKAIPADGETARIFNSLVNYAKRKDIKYRASIVTSKEVNAYATPNGEVVFYTGLLNALPKNDPSALAFVAAHEISHIDRKHADKKIQRALISGAAIMLLTARSKDWVKLSGVAAFGLVNSGYSREVESDADYNALSLMQQAGYDPNGAIVVLKIFENAASKTKGLTVFPTHPRPQDRLKNVLLWMNEHNVQIRDPKNPAPEVTQSPAATNNHNPYNPYNTK